MSIKHVEFDASATVAFGSITASYVNLLALGSDSDILWIFNSTNVAILVSLPSGLASGVLVYKDIRLPALATMCIDCRSNSKRIAKGTIQVKYASGAPTLGEVTITAGR